MRKRLIVAYTLLAGVPLLVLLAVLRAGGVLYGSNTGAAPGTEAAVPPAGVSVLIRQIVVILIASRLTGSLFIRLRQPRVMGEMVAGILLGPSVLGLMAPGIAAALFPPASLGQLNVLSQLGLVVFMFLVGLSLDSDELSGNSQVAVVTSHASIIAPFLLGVVSALYLYPKYSGPEVTFVPFALFMGTAVSITAFPVLARILTETGLIATKIGGMALVCAAVDDVTGWCILAFVMAVVRHSGSYSSASIAAGGVALFTWGMFRWVRPMWRRFADRFPTDSPAAERILLPVLIGVMLSALATESLGVHLLFGGFVAGAIMPRSAGFARYIHQRLETFTVLLLPLFFAFTGLRTSLGLLHGTEMWLCCAGIIVVAVLGKAGGSMAAARWAGMSWRESASIGVLLNTRGLMELVILNVGLDLHVLSQALFTMMVLMAIATTFMTAPLLRWLDPPAAVDAGQRKLEQEVAKAASSDGHRQRAARLQQ